MNTRCNIPRLFFNHKPKRVGEFNNPYTTHYLLLTRTQEPKTTVNREPD